MLTLFFFSNKQFLDLLIVSIFLFSILSIFILNFIIFFLLGTLYLICTHILVSWGRNLGYWFEISLHFNVGLYSYKFPSRNYFSCTLHILAYGVVFFFIIFSFPLWFLFDHWLLGSMSFNYHIFVNLHIFFLSLISNFIPLWSEQI